jgi:hypothetical protein
VWSEFQAAMTEPKSSDDGRASKGTDAKPVSSWKKLAIISLCGGAGLAITGFLILAAFLWIESRPSPQKPWNTTAILAKEPPGFDVSKDGTRIEFDYTLENNSTKDYRAGSSAELQLFLRAKDGTLGGPASDKDITLPIWIPLRQKMMVYVSLGLGSNDIPSKHADETDSAFHERLRAFLKERFHNMQGLVVFDQTNRYEIDLPKPLEAAQSDARAPQ